MRALFLLPHPPPPARSVIANFATSHSLDDSGLRCVRCFGTATKASALEWKACPCFSPSVVNEHYRTLALGDKLHLAGGAQDNPREPQDGPKRGPRGGPRIENSSLPPREGPRRPQEGPKKPQEAPKIPPKGPQEPQRGPKAAPKRLQNLLQKAPERPTTRSHRTLKRPLTHHPGTVAGWAEGQWITSTIFARSHSFWGSAEWRKPLEYQCLKRSENASPLKKQHPCTEPGHWLTS